jgi:hypothetical protein
MSTLFVLSNYYYYYYDEPQKALATEFCAGK